MPCVVASFMRIANTRNVKSKEYFCYPIAVFDFNFTEQSYVLYWNCKCLEQRDFCLLNKSILQKIRDGLVLSEKEAVAVWLKKNLCDSGSSFSPWYDAVDLDGFATRYEYPEITRMNKREGLRCRRKKLS